MKFQVFALIVGLFVLVAGVLFTADYAVFIARMKMEYGSKNVRIDRESCALFLSVLAVGVVIVYVSTTVDLSSLLVQYGI